MADFDLGFDFDAEDDQSSNDGPPPRAINQKNASLNVEDFLDGTVSTNTKKADAQFLKLFAETITAFNSSSEKKYKTSLMDTDINELPEVLERFFMVVVKKDGTSYNASSIGQFHQVAVRFFKERYHTAIDITKDVRFHKVKSVVNAKRTMATADGAKAGMNASKAIEPNLLRKAHQTGKLGRENPRALMIWSLVLDADRSR